jgi:hypothetical protein
MSDQNFFMAKKVPRLFPLAKAMMFIRPSVAESLRITVIRRKLAEDPPLGNVARVLGDQEIHDESRDKDENDFEDHDTPPLYLFRISVT